MFYNILLSMLYLSVYIFIFIFLYKTRFIWHFSVRHNYSDYTLWIASVKEVYYAELTGTVLTTEESFYTVISGPRVNRAEKRIKIFMGNARRRNTRVVGVDGVAEIIGFARSQLWRLVSKWKTTLFVCRAYRKNSQNVKLKIS